MILEFFFYFSKMGRSGDGKRNILWGWPNGRSMLLGLGYSPCFRVCTWSYEAHGTLTFLAGDFPRIFPALIFSPHLKNGQPAIFTNISTPGLMTSIRPTFNPTRVRSNTRNSLLHFHVASCCGSPPKDLRTGE